MVLQTINLQYMNYEAIFHLILCSALLYLDIMFFGDKLIDPLSINLSINNILSSIIVSIPILYLIAIIKMFYRGK